jgi:hypothetical protein
LCTEFATQSGRLDVVDEGSLPVDLHDRDPLPVAGLEVWIAGDVDLRVRHLLHVQDLPGALAEVAALRGVEDDLRDRYRA